MKAFVYIILLFSVSLTTAGQECNVIYVAPGGSSSGQTGTKDNPASLDHALNIANSANYRLYLRTGTYTVSSAIDLPSNIEVEGGFNADWRKTNGATTTIFRDNISPIPNPSRLIAINCNGISNFRLQDLTIRTANAFSNGTTTYGIYLNGCSDYKIVRCKIIAGNGGNGANGEGGTSGVSGTPGEAGENGSEDGGCCREGGAGGSSTFPGSHAGGEGGDGGERGTYIEWTTQGSAFPGYPGEDGEGPGGGYGGNGGLEIFVTIITISCDRTEVNDGQDGGPGAPGLNGANGAPGQDSYAGGYYMPGPGGSGDDGTHGSGGGGGGGGGSQGGLFFETIFNLIPNTNGAGAGGGGGGEGGQRGTGGEGGTGGGGSFAVFIWSNGTNGIIQDSEFQVGQGGLGGQGGPGGNGGQGGTGGQGGGQFNCDVGAGGNGGQGGKGGDGGDGGKGSNGDAQQLYENSSGTPVQLMNVNNLQQPVVRVRYSGCTNSPVEFSTDATGTATWYFGAGSSPTFATGQTVTASYTTMGRKTFTLVTNGIAYTYSDYLEIFRNGPTSTPEINSNSDQLCAGETGNFNSSVAADEYFWQIYNETDTVEMSGPGMQSITGVPFDTAGTYTVTLNTATNCCGISFPDTFTVTVDSIVLPEIAIQTSVEDSTNTICDEALVTFTASSQFVGPDPTYQWQVDGLNSGTDSPTFSTSDLDNGQSVTCIVTSSLACATGEQDTSNAITVTVIDIPEVVCSADSFVTDEPTYFFADVTSGGQPPFQYFWDFGDNTQGTGDTVAHIYTEDGTYGVNLEVVDANGCSSSCSTVVSTSSDLSANFTASAIEGCSPLEVEFTNLSNNAVTYFWNFGDGNTSSQTHPTHTYNSPGNYNVLMWAFGGNGNDSMLVTNQVVVYPSPEANFQAYPDNVTVAGDTVYFADNSSNASSWEWNFGDPASGDDNTSTEQNPTHIFSGNGCYDVTLLVSNSYGCEDSVTVTDFVCVTVGIAELMESEQFEVLNVYPVPFNNHLNVELFAPQNGQLTMELFSLEGRKVADLYNSSVNTGVQMIRWNSADVQLSKGAYLLRVTFEDQVINRPVMLH